MLSSGIFASFPIVLIFITTRLIDLGAAGHVVIALAVGEQLRLLITAGSNIHQGADVGQEWGSAVYLRLRVYFSLLAVIILALIINLNGLDFVGNMVIILFFFLNLVEAFGSVFMADFLRKGKMHIAGKMRSFGFFSVLIVFLVLSFFTDSLVLSLAVAFVFLPCVYIGWIWFYREDLGPVRVKVSFFDIKTLIIKVLPIFIAQFLMVYIINAQKYYLSFFASDEIVAIYAILFLPTGLLIMFFSFYCFGAAFVKTAEMYVYGDVVGFYRRVNKQFLILFIIFIPFILFISFLGVPILSWIYGVDLSPYLMYLILISSGALLNCATALLGVVLIIMRQQKKYAFCVSFIGAISTLTMLYLIWQHGLAGASLVNFVVFLPMTIGLYIVYRYTEIGENA